MKKIILTSNEFLSIYTGYLLGENFSVVLNGLEKYFGYPVTTVETIECAKKFRQQISKSNPELVSVMNKLGNFKKDRNIDINTQINNYVERFEQMYGKSVELNQYQGNELSM